MAARATVLEKQAVISPIPTTETPVMAQINIPTHSGPCAVAKDSATVTSEIRIYRMLMPPSRSRAVMRVICSRRTVPDST